jgi:hypothetical protein
MNTIVVMLKVLTTEIDNQTQRTRASHNTHHQKLLKLFFYWHISIDTLFSSIVASHNQQNIFGKNAKHDIYIYIYS